MPFSDTQQATSPRYRWRCDNRGPEPYVILQWTLSGEGIYEGRRGIQRVPAGYAFFAITPERSVYYYPPDAREPWVFSWLSFYGPVACALFRSLRARFGSVAPLPPRGGAASALRRLLALAKDSDVSARSRLSLQAYAFVLEWMREAAGPPTGGQNALERAVQYCRQHFREPLSVKEIAHEAGMSREHFTRFFARAMRRPPAAYLRDLRLREAATLLRETELPLREIAMRSGFYSTRHLMRAFQRLHRVGPAAYRRRVAGHPAPVPRPAESARPKRP